MFRSTGSRRSSTAISTSTTAARTRPFPACPIFAQNAEWEAAHEPDYTIPEWVDFDGADYRLIDGGEHLLAVGVDPAHARPHAGHQSLVIDSPDERVILAGQACFSPEEWLGADAGEGARRAWSLERYDASIDLMKALDPDVVWFAHAREPWRK